MQKYLRELAMRRVLSTIDQLPETAMPALQAAQEALVARQHTQIEIRRELNDALNDLGLPPIPASSFNRWAQKKLRRVEVAPQESFSLSVRSALAALVAAIRDEKRA